MTEGNLNLLDGRPAGGVPGGDAVAPDGESGATFLPAGATSSGRPPAARLPEELPPCLSPPRPGRVARGFLLGVAALAIAATWALAHDMFLKPSDYFPATESESLVRLLNGTFSVSENAITRDRLLDVSIVSPSGRVRLDTTAWTAAGDTSSFTLRTGGPGT